LGWGQRGGGVLERIFEIDVFEGALLGLVRRFQTDGVQIARELVRIEALGGQEVAALVLGHILGRMGQRRLQGERGVVDLVYIPLYEVVAGLPRQLAGLLQQRG
jgi:hypothetical protein